MVHDVFIQYLHSVLTCNAECHSALHACWFWIQNPGVALKGVEFPFCIQCLSIAALVVEFYLHSISSYVLDVFFLLLLVCSWVFFGRGYIVIALVSNWMKVVWCSWHDVFQHIIWRSLSCYFHTVGFGTSRFARYLDSSKETCSCFFLACISWFRCFVVFCNAKKDIQSIIQAPGNFEDADVVVPHQF